MYRQKPEACSSGGKPSASRSEIWPQARCCAATPWPSAPGRWYYPRMRRCSITSRETRLILRQAAEIGPQASRLASCSLPWRTGWANASSGASSPAHCVEAACAQALVQGIYSYKRVLALTERVFADALATLEAVSSRGNAPGPAVSALTQQHELIRDADEYADLFAHAAAVTATTGRTVAQGDLA